MIRTLTFSFLGLLTAFTTLAQTPGRGNVTGKLTAQGGKAVEFATLMLVKAQDSTLVKGAVSDATGKYAFENVVAGQYRVAAQQIGYKKTFSEPFALTAEQPNWVVPALEMAEEAKTLTEVKVTAQKPFIEQQVDRTVVNVENSIVASGNTALEVLEKAPGVTIDRQNDQVQLKGKQGVIIMIDGKQTYLSQQEVSNLLKNTPSDNIEKIEIITNPGSKYDAAGNSGIINIKMKKNKNVGTNGSAIVGTGLGAISDTPFEAYNGRLLPKGNSTLNLNHRAGNVNVFGNVSYANRRSFNTNTLNRIIPFEGRVTNFDQHAIMPSRSSSLNYKLGMDYSLSKKSTIGVVFNGFSNAWRSDGLNDSRLTNEAGNVLSRPFTNLLAKEQMTNYTGNVNFKHEFDGKGQELTADVDYVRYDGRNENRLKTQFFGVGNEKIQPDQYVRNVMPSEINIWAAKLDYVKPMKNGAKFETGLKSSYVNSDNDMKFDTLRTGGSVWDRDPSDLDPRRTNRFKYDEYISAVYASYAGQLTKTLKVQAGLRAEHTHSVGNSVTLNQQVTRNYLNLFPTVFLSQQLDSSNVVNVSYSRRIDRPNYQDLNPFEFYLDPFTFQQGNPFVRPQYTNSFELTHVYKGAISTTFGYSRTYDFINRETPFQIAAENKTFIRPTNLDQFNNLSLNVSFPVPITKWWMMQNNVTVFHNRFKTFLEGQLFDVRVTAYNVYSSNNFKLSKTLSAEVAGWYNSRGIYGFFVAQPMGAFTLGLQKQLMNKKATLKVNVNDPLWLNQFRGSTQFGDINFRINSRWESRQVRATFTYRFGNQNVKAARQRESATSSEQGRVKGGN